MSVRNAAAGLMIAIVLFGCPKSTPEPAPASGTATAPEPVDVSAKPEPTPPPAEPEVKKAWLGVWKSDSCGERKYVREVTFADGGAVTGRDLISPCPKGAVCAWSGIVDWKGTYEVKGDTIALDVAISGGPKGKLTLPTALGWDQGKELVVEDPGGAACAYARGAAGDPAAK